MTDIPAQSPAELYTLAQRAAAAGQLEEARRLFEWAEAAAGKAAQPAPPPAPPLQAPDLRTYLERRYQPPEPPPAATQAPTDTSTAPGAENAPQGPQQGPQDSAQDGEQAEQPAPPRRWAGGRPRKPPGTTGESRSIRLNEPRWLKLRALGMEWLAAQIDAAPMPTNRPELAARAHALATEMLAQRSAALESAAAQVRTLLKRTESA